MSNTKKPRVAVFSTFIMAVSGLAFATAGAMRTSGVKTAAYAGRPDPFSAPSSVESCQAQRFQEAEARFIQLAAIKEDTLPPNTELRTSAAAYIAESEKCYLANERSASSADADDPPPPIDDGGMWASSELGPKYVLRGTKWGLGSQFSTPPGIAGGTVTYSYMPNGLSFSAEGYGVSVAIQSLATFAPCFLTDIANAFAAWSAVADIQFLQAADNNAAFDASGAQADIRIGAHSFDGPSGVLAHAYYPPPNGASAAGDVHFDSQETWTCNTTGIDIGIVTMHELGHSIGLDHQNATILAVMNPIYNRNLPVLQPDDAAGAAAIYGPPPLPPVTIAGNAGVADATVSYEDGGPHTVTSDGDGNYSFLVPSGWTGTVTPSRLGYIFSPPSRTYSVPGVLADATGQDFTPQPNAKTVGVFRPSSGALFMKNSNATGFADLYLTYGIPGDYPVVGDWDGNGSTTLGVFRGGTFYLRNSNTNGFADNAFGFGVGSHQPIAGDWNNDGVDTIGVYDSATGTFFLRNTSSTGAADMTFTLGIPGDVGIAGDWNGDGVDTVGVFRPSNGALYLKNTNATGFADIVATYGIPGDKPVTGDWDGNGTDTIGVYRGGTFYLRNTNTVGFADLVFTLGIPGDMPIAGDWDGLP